MTKLPWEGHFLWMTCLDHKPLWRMASPKQVACKVQFSADPACVWLFLLLRTKWGREHWSYVRGAVNLKRYNTHNSLTSCCKLGLYASNESYGCLLSNGVWQLDVLQGVTEWLTKIKRVAGRGQPDLTVQSSKQNKTVWCGKWKCPSHSACHLAISLSYASYHTSFERRDSGLPADMKIRTIVQLIGILWS